MLLVIGLAVILIALVGVVVDASRLFLYRRALATAADGAVTAAVQAVDEAAIYRDPNAFTGGGLPIDPSAAGSAVDLYVQDNDLSGRFDAFRVESVDVTGGGTTVRVIFSARVRLPFAGLLPLRSVNEPRTVVAATARAPIE